jgi:hypothetical protein
MSALVTLVIAIVTQNSVALRGVPREAAPQQATLPQGEVLEVRGQRGDYVSVYDHRLERAGYVRASQVREVGLAPEDAPGLLAVVRFVRDTPGSEALGISYAAAYLKAAPAEQITAEPFDAIGGMAERLARRASKPAANKAASEAMAASLEVAAQSGIRMTTIEREGQAQLCYDGDMYRRVLAMAGADPMQRARATLALTRHDCVDPALGQVGRRRLDEWRATLLARVPTIGLDVSTINRLHLRRAGVLAALAYWQVRNGEGGQVAASQAVDELAAVRKQDLDGDDVGDYAEAAIRVGATRPAASPTARRPGRLVIKAEPGAVGQTCVSLFPAKGAGTEPLVRRCTYGTVWENSALGNAAGSALALSVQPLVGWRELWVFHQAAEGWVVDVLPPGSDDPELGYAECAGWTPDSSQLLVVREVRSEGHYRRRFEVVDLSTLLIRQQAGTPDLLPGFGRWQDPLWRSTTVALR